MGKKQAQMKWNRVDGVLTGTFPDSTIVVMDLKQLYRHWNDYDEAEKFYAEYAVKQKNMDYSSDPKWSYADKKERAEELFEYVATNRKMPATKRGGGYDIVKQVAKKIEKREVPLTEEQTTLLKELGLM